MGTFTVTAAGETVTVTFNTEPAVPVLPTVEYAALNPVAGELLQTTLNRLTSPARVHLPAGTYKVADFKQGYYNSLFSGNCLGILGDGAGKTIVQLVPMSSTQAAIVPAQSSGQTNPLAMVRLGPGSAGNLRQAVNSGWSLIGTTQPPSSNNPLLPGHAFGGIRNEYGNGSVFQDMILTAASYGDWNSPPGETFGINNWHDVNTVIRNVEVSGLNQAGQKVGGSPIGFSQSTNVLVEGCNLHDAFVSGLTFSVAGNFNSLANCTNGVTTRNVRVAHNGNTASNNGKDFPGFNHENVIGKILHAAPDIQLDGITWVSNHMLFGNTLVDNPTIVIQEPIWHEAPPMHNGCFTVRMPATFMGVATKQKTLPTVIKNGATLAPYVITGYPSKMLPVDPTKNYVVNAS
jgi:hypothetical protein